MANPTEIHRPRRPAWAAVLSLAAIGAVCLALALAGQAPAVGAETRDQFRDTDLTLALQRNGELSFVTVELLLADDGSGNFEAQADAARASVLARFPGAVVVANAQVSAQYVLASFRWANKTTNWNYNPAGKPASLTGDANAIAAAAASWATLGANFGFSGGNATAAAPGACQDVTDGQNTVGWYQQSGTVLAMTCTYWNQLGNATEFDMQIDPSWSWTTSSSSITVDLQSVVAHEFGHALGLKHPCDFNQPTTCSAADKAAMMYGVYTSRTNKRVQQSDDIAGIIALYGASTAAVTPTPVPVPQPVLPYRVPIAGIARG